MVSFWDAVKTTFTRDPARGEGVYPRRFVAGIVIRQFIGTGASRSAARLSVLPPNQQTPCTPASTPAPRRYPNLPLKIYSKCLNKGRSP